MNSTRIKKSILNLSLCLLTVFTLTSCSSQSRDPAAEEQASIDNKSDVSKLQDSEYGPQKFHSKRFESYNENY
ncbi:MAG: hypothetical protein K2Q18_08745 [Bdellovibrionales bacterium]|nr:hypothetical protein [Bdellovibrionales bacterium]